MFVPAELEDELEKLAELRRVQKPRVQRRKQLLEVVDRGEVEALAALVPLGGGYLSGLGCGTELPHHY